MTKKLSLLSSILVVIITVIVITPITTVSAQQSGYSLTVNVPTHEFGKSSVVISIKTANGHNDMQTVSTTGSDVSWTFDIPPGQGDSVQVCVSGDVIGGVLGLGNCKRFIASGNDITVTMGQR